MDSGGVHPRSSSLNLYMYMAECISHALQEKCYLFR